MHAVLSHGCCGQSSGQPGDLWWGTECCIGQFDIHGLNCAALVKATLIYRRQLCPTRGYFTADEALFAHGLVQPLDQTISTVPQFTLERRKLHIRMARVQSMLK